MDADRENSDKRDMVAGRELDARIAEKIFGCKVKWNTFPKGERILFCDEPCERHGMDPIDFYSTDIAAAWEVVEKLQLLKDRCLKFAFDRWEIGQDFVGDEWNVVSSGESAPHAICLAALTVRSPSTSRV